MRGWKESQRGRKVTAKNSQRNTTRKLQYALRQEVLEERLALSGTGFDGNPCAPDLDLSLVGTQSAVVGEEFTLDLYASGAYVEDLDADGNASGDTIRLQLDPDDNPTGATLTSDGILHWTLGSDFRDLLPFAQCPNGHIARADSSRDFRERASDGRVEDRDRRPGDPGAHQRHRLCNPQLTRPGPSCRRPCRYGGRRTWTLHRELCTAGAASQS